MADDVAFLVPGMPPFRKKKFAVAQGGLAQFHFESGVGSRRQPAHGPRAWQEVNGPC
jgi:hypothetical protein